jgi:CRISPR/Cas system-associated exonuclease Cas4 (RecB family)
VMHDVPVDRHQIEKTKRIAERVWRSIRAGNFFPSPGPLNCYSCPYRQPCRAWKG